MWEVVKVASTICTSLGYIWRYSMGISVFVNFVVCDHKRKWLYLVHFHFTFIYLRMQCILWTHEDATYLLNLTHLFLRQIWSFSKSFVYPIVLPVTWTIDASCLCLTCAHCAAAHFTSHTAAHSREDRQCMKPSIVDPCFAHPGVVKLGRTIPRNSFSNFAARSD